MLLVLSANLIVVMYWLPRLEALEVDMRGVYRPPQGFYPCMDPKVNIKVDQY